MTSLTRCATDAAASLPSTVIAGPLLTRRPLARRGDGYSDRDPDRDALGMTNQQDRARRHANDLLGHAAHQEMRHAASPVCAHDDQVHVSSIGVADDFFGRRA